MSRFKKRIEIKLPNRMLELRDISDHLIEGDIFHITTKEYDDPLKTEYQVLIIYRAEK